MPTSINVLLVQPAWSKEVTLEECLEGHEQTTTMKVMFGDTVISSKRDIAIGPEKDVCSIVLLK